MKIYAVIKQVPDTEAKVELTENSSGIKKDSIKWIVNPYDEYAIEEALLLKKNIPDSKLTVITLGPKKATDALRTALAMGADEAVLINTEDSLDTFNLTKAIAEVIKSEGDYSMVFAGKQSTDGSSSSVPQFLAEHLGIPHISVVSSFSYNNGSATIERDTDGGAKEIYSLTGPAVIAANKGLNKPRYASLPGIMKAKKKPLKEVSLQDLSMDSASPLISYSDFQLPPKKETVKIIEGEPGNQAKELVNLLKNEAKVL